MFVCEVGDTTIYSVAFSPDGTLLVGTKDGRMLRVAPFSEPQQLFNAEMIYPYIREKYAVYSVCAGPEGRAFAAGQGGYGFTGPNGSFGDAAWATLHPAGSIALWDEETIVVGEGDRNQASAGRLVLRSWKSMFNEDYYKLHKGGSPPKHFITFAEPRGVRAVAAHAATGLVAWSTGHQKITLWNPRGQDPVHIPLKHTAAAIAFHPDGTRLAVSQEWGAKIIDLAKRHEVATLAGHTGRMTCLAYRPDGRVLATGSWDATVRLWDAATGSAIGSLSAPVGRVFSLCYASDGLRLAAAGDAGNVVLWDVD